MGKDLSEYLPKIIEGVVGKILRIIHRLSSPINFWGAGHEGGGEGGGGRGEGEGEGGGREGAKSYVSCNKIWKHWSPIILFLLFLYF